VIARIRGLFSRNGNTRESLDLNEAIQEIVLLKLNEIRNGNIALRMELSNKMRRAVGDRVQLQQVITSLITNAIQAMNGVENRQRELLLRTEMVGEAEVQVTVQDTGIGVEPSKVDQIFEAFYTTKSDGMGMGLWISRSIVEKHGGRLWVAQSKGPGTTIILRLPLQP
jgi:signal transduction histidine kinase